MAYKEEEYDHFHVVAICVECADIQVIGLAKDKKALSHFFENVASDLEEVAHNNPMGPYINFKIEIVIPNEILKIVPEDGHNTGHVSTCIVHKCTDKYEFCAEAQRAIAFKKMAMMMTSKFMDMLKPKGSKNREEKIDKSEDAKARSILNSLDLPDDLFKGFN